MKSFHISVTGKSRTKAGHRPSLAVRNQAERDFLSASNLSSCISAGNSPRVSVSKSCKNSIAVKREESTSSRARLFAKTPLSLGPPFSAFVDSTLVKPALCIWPDAFSPSVQRPETIPGRVVGGLYTGNVAELLHLCFLKTHVNFRGRMGRSGELMKPLFSWRCLNPCWFWLLGSGSLLFPSPSRGGTSLHRALVLWLWGSEVAFKDPMCFSSLWRRTLWVLEH